MCSSEVHTTPGEAPSGQGSIEAGFTLIEMLVSLCLSMILTLAVAPLYVSLQEMAATAESSAIRRATWEVVRVRLTRDLRQACAIPEAGWGTNPVVCASPSEIVFLTRDARTGAPELVEWEIAGGSIMRRAVTWSGPPPSALAHTMYKDHKTMIEGVERGIFAAQTSSGPLDLRASPWRPDGVRAFGLELDLRRRSPREHRLQPRMESWMGR